jgi:hypothetical protein
MRIEYISGDDEYCPLIRLFDFTPQEIAELRRVVDQLANGGIREFDLARLPFATMVGDVQFVFRLTDRDQGIKETLPMTFELCYTIDGFEDVSWRLNSFERPAIGHQWLLDVPSDFQLLISPDGSW